MPSFHRLLWGVTLLALLTLAPSPRAEALRYAIVGLVHDHARGFIPAARDRKDVDLVAVVEPNQELVRRYVRDHRLPEALVHTDLERMLDTVKPQAVAVFTSTFDHLRVVEACAARGVHVMMEKPLAVNLDHARAMNAAARSSGIHVLVNYETTWYPANHAAYQHVHGRDRVGPLRKMVVRSGHQGPREIGCSEDFLAWLTDPVLNGGGALADFGCYGANLMTWLMNGQRPRSVLAVTQQIKPAVYPRVDDEATILLTYPEAQGIIEASWNWPYGRKDMEIYGRTGAIFVPHAESLTIRREGQPLLTEDPARLPAASADPLAYLRSVVRGELQPEGLSSLPLNLIVTEILEAARESAHTGRRIDLPAKPPF